MVTTVVEWLIVHVLGLRVVRIITENPWEMRDEGVWMFQHFPFLSFSNFREYSFPF